jgi:HEAT repeat protein
MPLFGPNVKKLEATGDVSGLIQALSCLKDSAVRKEAARALGQIGDLVALAPLAAALNDRDSDVGQAVLAALGKMAAPRLDQIIQILGVPAVDDERKAAAEALVQVGGSAVEPLIAALKHRNGFLRERAARALGRIGDARAIEPLIGILDDTYDFVHEAAAVALVQFGASALEPLMAALNDRDTDTRRTAAGTLDRLGWSPGANEAGAAYWVAKGELDKAAQIGAPAVGPLVSALEDQDKDIRKVAVHALDLLGWSPDSGESGAAYWVTRRDFDKCVQIGGAAVGPLAAALQDKDEEIRCAAVEALGQIGDARAVESLLLALQDRNRDVSGAAAEALEKLAWTPDVGEAGGAFWAATAKWDKCVQIGAPAVEPLIAELKGGDHAVRQAAAEALGRIGDARATTPLVFAALRDREGGVRDAAVKALVDIGDASAFETLISALDDRNIRLREAGARAFAPIQNTRGVSVDYQDKDVRRAAARALGAIGDPAAVAALGGGLKDRDDDVRKAAAGALVQIGAPAVEPLVAALSDPNEDACETAVKALVQIGVPTVEPLIATLNDAHSRSRRPAARALGEIGDARAIGPLVATLKDQDGEMRRAAADALHRLAWSPDSGKAGPEYWVIRGDWYKCVETGAPAVEAVAAALTGGDRGVRRAASDTLVQIGAPAVDALVAALQDQDREVCRAAAEALTAIYRSGKLGPEQRALVLAQRAEIMRATATP